MLRVRAGDLAAFELLVLRYQAEAWRVAYRFTGDAAQAEDLAQDAFLKIRGILKECRVGIQKSADGARKPDRVLQLVMACFPMTRVEGVP